VVVQARSSISIDREEFVEPGVRPGHEGLFPFTGTVHVGERRTFQVSLTAPAGENRFRIIDSRVKRVRCWNSRRQARATRSANSSALYPEARCFPVALQGQDAAGYP
jgi:hypothetical protein